ncbi:MAG TPA: SDR family oxidoreductase [Acidimicrobiales bacterium]|jgi:NAD(P)-dependent dehydrogenase (short-subunit alcohol dehydrogenase family)
MKGKTVIVTGGNSGIGFETAAALAAMGARVVITARNAGRGESACHALGQRAGSGGSVELVVFDLGDLASVRSGAAELLDRCPRIDVLVNNAGLILTERAETVDGFEATFGINHLGPFLLTNLLLDRLKASAPSRVVNVASTAHNQARKGMPFDDLQSTGRYGAMRVYGISKLANILFTNELARRLEGTGVTANSLHPGTVRTGYGADGDAKGLLSIGLAISKPFFLSPAKGARTSIYLATSPDVAGVTGKYFAKCKEKRPRPQALDAAAATRLWDVSDQLVGLAV